ncbi:MAG: aminotransferase class V-fold PLP-dependent enzyme [Pirellulaceae bacterium]|nr:aminotransferase class V-fold PLP-dependent enzyme [Pirellulaceae bacterium]
MNDSLDIAAIRDEFPALQKYTWFQNGSVSITPRSVTAAFDARMAEIHQRGPLHIVYPDEEYPRRHASKQIVATFLGAAAEDLALVRGVSEAFQVVLSGISWEAGDEIVVSADEEAALLLPALHLSEARGVRVQRLELDENLPRQAAQLDKLLSRRTKLLAISHVTTDCGHRLPIDDLCGIARRRDVLSFVDAAHSAGVFPMRLDELTCDFAAVLSYKWMYAPYAAGMLYADREAVSRLGLTFAGGRSEQSLDFEKQSFELRETAERFQYGPWCWPLVHAWAAAAEWLDSIGVAEIERRTRLLTNQLKDGLLTIPGLRLLTPRPWSASAALVTVELTERKGEAISQQLRDEYRMIVKPLPHTREGLRISVPFLLLEAEIDGLLTALNEILR